MSDVVRQGGRGPSGERRRANRRGVAVTRDHRGARVAPNKSARCSPAEPRLPSHPQSRYATICGTLDGELVTVVVKLDGSVRAPAALRLRMALVASVDRASTVHDAQGCSSRDPLQVTRTATRACDTVLTVDLEHASARARVHTIRLTSCISSIGTRPPPWDVFSIDVVDRSESVVVRLAGELDIAFADDVTRALLAITTREVVVDLSALTFLDARGLSALLAAKATAAARGRAVHLCGAQGIVQRVFEITGLGGVLDIDSN